MNEKSMRGPLALGLCIGAGLVLLGIVLGNSALRVKKLAHDSNSTVGKIKRASQGQFSISDRCQNNPYIKKVRVVSTVEYYLAD